MTQAIAYLNFDGTCAEAMRFYEQALGAKIAILMTGAESPVAASMPREFANRIMHARLILPGGSTLMAGDNPPHMPYEGIKGVSIALDYETVEEAEKVFNALAVGGRVTMPMAPAFWAEKFGMLIDKFGLPWIVNGVMLPM
ncbi:VOC family protein [soil metagenome]